jgi:hypothetical protein
MATSGYVRVRPSGVSHRCTRRDATSRGRSSIRDLRDPRSRCRSPPAGLSPCSRRAPRRLLRVPPIRASDRKPGADDRIRTRDPHLGNVERGSSPTCIDPGPRACCPRLVRATPPQPEGRRAPEGDPAKAGWTRSPSSPSHGRSRPGVHVAIVGAHLPSQYDATISAGNIEPSETDGIFADEAALEGPHP